MENKLEVRHGEMVREMSPASLAAKNGQNDPGKFGRMFPALPALKIGDDALFDLALAMKDATPSDPVGDNPLIPAGFTYLGQFVDHDITLDLTPLEQQREDPFSTTNFRTPGLDLDALYGSVPQLTPYIFQRDAATFKQSTKLIVGKAAPSPDIRNGGAPDIPELPNDLPRSSHGRAILGDERNDENLLVGQTHLAFIKFHNAIVDRLGNGSGALRGQELFKEARRIATWHYQWIVLFDFIERLTEPGLIKKIKHDGRRFYRFRSRPYIPVEFAAAAYRLGHSMVREDYNYNRVFGPPGGPPATLNFLFNFTGKSGTIVGDLAAQDIGPPNTPMKRLPSNWVIDWRRFFDFNTPAEPGFALNPTRLIDPAVVPQLHTLPGEANREAVLPFRNLRRGVILGLPSGQSIARAMGIPPLTGDEIATDSAGSNDAAAAKRNKLHTETPLWYYILKEAKLIHGGKRLGPIGSTIIAETFLGLVHGDQESFMFRRTNWTPELPRKDQDNFTMVDLLNFVGDINPLGP